MTEMTAKGKCVNLPVRVPAGLAVRGLFGGYFRMKGRMVDAYWAVSADRITCCWQITNNLA